VGAAPRAPTTYHEKLTHGLWITFIKKVIDKRPFVWYIITMRSEEVREEQRKTVERVKRWNESVRQVRELTRQWQRDNEAHLGPFLHPVENEES
jgi:hypothetical protein